MKSRPHDDGDDAAQAVRDLQILRNRYAELFDSAPCGYLTLDADQRIVTANRTFAHLVGRDPDDLVDLQLSALLPAKGDARAAWARHWDATVSGATPAAVEFQLRRSDGTAVDAQFASQAAFDESGRLFECRTTVTDITERKRAEARIRETEALARAVFDRTTNPIFVIDDDGRFADCNAAAERFLGIPRVRWLGSRVPDVFGALSTTADQNILRAMRKGHGPLEIACRTAGGPRILELALIPLTRAGRSMTVALGTDITERKAAESDLRRELLHDSLTNLPNRILLAQALETAVKRRRRNPVRDFAVLFLDIDRFKETNDTMGHLDGDRMLVEVASRLRRCVREIDLIARYGGDEFVVLMDDLRSGQDATSAAERILAALRQPFRLSEGDVTTGVSIGLALASSCAASNAEGILREADAAMYRAKAMGRGRYEFSAPIPPEARTSVSA